MGGHMKQKGFLLATAATGAAAVAPGALAADLPARAPAPVVVPPAASWAGFYVGLHAGVNWQQSHNKGEYASIFDLQRTDSTGFIGGGQIGYNWQNGNFVFGIEVDGSWLSNKASVRAFEDDRYSASNRVRWLVTARPRFGLAVGNTMAYTTAGVAFAGMQNTAIFGSSQEVIISDKKTRVGWAVGGGVEHMWTQNFTIALEGLFVDLGQQTIIARRDDMTTRFSNQAVIARFKANYKF